MNRLPRAATGFACAAVLFGCAGGPLSGDLPGQNDGGAVIGEVAGARERARIHTELAGAYYQRGNLGVALAEGRTDTALSEMKSAASPPSLHCGVQNVWMTG